MRQSIRIIIQSLSVYHVISTWMLNRTTWYLGSGNKTIKISLGNVDDSAAKAGDGKGSSYLSHSTGYFNYPTAPSDLRAVYVNDTTERLERK